MKKKWLAALGIFLFFVGGFGFFASRQVTSNPLTGSKSRVQSESGVTKLQRRTPRKVQEEYRDASLENDGHPCHENRNN